MTSTECTCPAESYDRYPLNPAVIKDLILNKLEYPCVLKGYLLKLNSWKCTLWTKEQWATIFENKILDVRFGKRIKNSEKLLEPQWESKCLKGKMSYKELVNWDEGDQLMHTICGKEISSKQFWAYFDYYYLKNLMDANSLNDILSWKDFGFPELKTADSTLWIGTSEANTPCHIDTYGCNIVCQIYGKKHWTLFPEDQSKYLYATRYPYEESSIYSKVAFPSPDILKFPLTNLTTPYMVTLETGDVLLVPKHWWHFVESTEFSISINTWIPLSSDHADKLKEAIVMYQIGSLCQSITSPDLLTDILNPNMMYVATLTSSELLRLLIERLSNSLPTTDKETSPPKINKKSGTKTSYSEILSELKEINIYPLKPFQFTDYITHKKLEKPIYTNTVTRPIQNYSGQNDAIVLKLLLESFSDDRVTCIIKQVLEEKLLSCNYS